jgi:O-antigen ligase
MTADPREASPGRYVVDWLAPALFALLVSATIRFHSLIPSYSMPRIVGNLLALAALLLLMLLASGRRLNPPRPIGTLLVALAAAATFSALASGSIDVSLLRLELYLAMAALGVVFYLTYRDNDGLPLAGYFLGIALVHLPFLLAAIIWISDLTPPSFWAEYGPRMAHFAHVRQYGEFAFLAAASGTVLGALSRRLVVPSLVLAAAAVFGIVLTGCRGALLSWLLFTLLLCVFGPSRLRMAVLGSVVMAFAAGLVWYLDQSGVLPSPNIFRRVAELSETAGPKFDSGRLPLWMASLKQILAHPFFGNGPEGYWLSGCCDRNILQAHNFVLQLLIEFGVIGCGLLALILWFTVGRLGGFASVGRLVAASPGNRVLACLLGAFLAYSLIDQTMYHLLPLLHFALFAGLFAAGLAQARGAATALR